MIPIYDKIDRYTHIFILFRFRLVLCKMKEIIITGIAETTHHFAEGVNAELSTIL